MLDRTWTWATMGLVLTGLAWGCGTPPRATSTGPLSAADRPREMDIPVPASFRFEPQASEDFRSGRRRIYVRLRYVGPADKQSAREFFRREMPLARWTLISDADLHGWCVLRFEKGLEACEVTIRDAASGRGGPTMIDIRVTPLDRVDAPAHQK